ncbi:MAG: hypothetical protein NZT92_17960 [Abditibacteriales bacterium]|nr:hypothetical protein [Abditibacteriales bacterium]MDW8368047.1 hypothetical protein [Abditibacteriales bacterium]
MNLNLPSSVDACRAWLEKDPLNVEAARQLREGIAAAEWHDDPALMALWEACVVLDGGAEGNVVEAVDRTPRKLDRSRHEALVVHPREKRERRHKLASLFGRVLHLLEGDETARAIARVTEKATPQTFPQLCRAVEACAQALDMNAPDIRIARGEERLFTVMVDRSPFLCVHHDFVSEGDGAAPQRLSLAEMRFGVAHNLQHIKGGHAALLQISPERLEDLILEQVPFLVRTPIKLGTKVLGWTRANRAVKRVSELLPKKSRTQKVVNTVGELLPDAEQETVLPEVVHDWVRSWIQGVEFSADRAGLLLSGSLAASCQALLHLAPDYAPHISDARRRGVRWLLQEKADVDRTTADRVRELLRFAVSAEYLRFVGGK